MCVNWFLQYIICIHTCKLIICQNGKLLFIFLINIYKTVYNEYYNFDKYVLYKYDCFVYNCIRNKILHFKIAQ